MYKLSAANIDNLESIIETMLLQLSVKDSQDRKAVMYLPAGIICHSMPPCFIHTVLKHISKVTCHLLKKALHHEKNVK